jgi:hypothetical protein
MSEVATRHVSQSPGATVGLRQPPQRRLLRGIGQVTPADRHVAPPGSRLPNAADDACVRGIATGDDGTLVRHRRMLRLWTWQPAISTQSKDRAASDTSWQDRARLLEDYCRNSDRTNHGSTKTCGGRGRQRAGWTNHRRRTAFRPQCRRGSRARQAALAASARQADLARRRPCAGGHTAPAGRGVLGARHDDQGSGQPGGVRVGRFRCQSGDRTSGAGGRRCGSRAPWARTRGLRCSTTASRANSSGRSRNGTSKGS